MYNINVCIIFIHTPYLSPNIVYLYHLKYRKKWLIYTETLSAFFSLSKTAIHKKKTINFFLKTRQRKSFCLSFHSHIWAIGKEFQTFCCPSKIAMRKNLSGILIVAGTKRKNYSIWS